METTTIADACTIAPSFMDKAWNATRQMLSQATTPQTALVAGVAVAATGLAVLAWNRRAWILDTTCRASNMARSKMAEVISPAPKAAAAPAAPIFDEDMPEAA